ncbi:hypothetical protein LINPERPRIM_LOCUS21209, partial [Linum perenne]
GPHRSSFVDYSALSKDDKEALDDIVSVIISDDDGKKANYSGDDLHCSPKSPPHVGIVPPKVSSPLETLVHAIQMKEVGVRSLYTMSKMVRWQSQICLLIEKKSGPFYLIVNYHWPYWIHILIY